jgi:hypothetical protein
LKSLLLSKIHRVPYAGHLDYEKTIVTVKNKYNWPSMKNEVTNFIARCIECKKVKDEKKHPAGLIQPFSILERKWKVVTMDFITKCPRTTKKHDSIMVVVENLTKSSHFILVKLSYKVANIVERYMREVAKRHGVPKNIVCDRDSKFTLNFWKGMFKVFGTNMNFITLYHPKIDGQTERVNQVIKDMLRMYVMDKPSKWEDYFHLVDFAYNKGYQSYLKMSPFEPMYGRRCNTPMSWDNPTDHAVVVTNLP